MSVVERSRYAADGGLLQVELGECCDGDSPFTGCDVGAVSHRHSVHVERAELTDGDVEFVSREDPFRWTGVAGCIASRRGDEQMAEFPDVL